MVERRATNAAAPIMGALCAAVIATAPMVAAGAGLRDLADGWLLTAGETGWLLERPALPREDDARSAAWSLSAGTARLYGLPELPVSGLAAAATGFLGGVQWQAEAGWETTGEDFFREEVRTAGFACGHGTLLGAAVRDERMRIAGEPAGSRTRLLVTARRSVAVGGGTWLRASVAVTAAERREQGAGPVRTAFAEAALLRPAAGLGLAVAIDRDAGGAPLLSLEAGAALTSRFGLGMRADPPTGACGPVTWWRTGPLLVRTSHLAHPDLGPTHRVQLTVARRRRGRP